LAAAGLTAKDLPGLKGSDPSKLVLAEKLEMKSAANVSQQLRRLDRRRRVNKAPPALLAVLLEVKPNEGSR
jgi:hypothetical protein